MSGLINAVTGCLPGSFSMPLSFMHCSVMVIVSPGYVESNLEVLRRRIFDSGMKKAGMGKDLSIPLPYWTNNKTSPFPWT